MAQAEKLTPYSNRFGANKLAALKKYGGTKETGLFGIKGDANTVQNHEQWARKGGWTSAQRKRFRRLASGREVGCILIAGARFRIVAVQYTVSL